MDILSIMKDPKSYPDKTSEVAHKQTHISHVFLTDKYVYKIKKPVDFGFLDFTTLEKRKKFCEEEVRLNQRLCKELYLGVVPIDSDGKLEGCGTAVEYAVKMKRMPEESLMVNLLENDKVDYTHLKRIAKMLSEAYSRQGTSEEIRNYAGIQAVKKNTDQNFAQTEKYLDSVFDRKKYDFIKSATDAFYRKKQKLMEMRQRKYAAEFHGDLHSGNIFIDGENVCIFDCIEFNNEFRMGDVASDIAFLAMDLDYKGKQYLSKYFITKFVDLCQDYTLYAILDFYKCYRAYVRAKVTAFMLDDIHVQNKDDVMKTAQAYFDLACNYAKTFSNARPAVLIACGITATGKSRWLKIGSDIINASILRTDAIRRKVLGLTGKETKDAAFYEKYYTEEKRQQIYDIMFAKGEEILSMGGKVAFDASFINKANRGVVKKLADKYHADFIMIHTTAAEEEIRSRTVKRFDEKGNVSDGDFENTYRFQKEHFEKPTEDEGSLIVINSEEEEYHNLMRLKKYLEDTLGI